MLRLRSEKTVFQLIETEGVNRFACIHPPLIGELFTFENFSRLCASFLLQRAFFSRRPTIHFFRDTRGVGKGEYVVWRSGGVSCDNADTALCVKCTQNHILVFLDILEFVDVLFPSLTRIGFSNFGAQKNLKVGEKMKHFCGITSELSIRYFATL